MNRAAHATLVLIGIMPWAVGMTCLWISMHLAVLADRVWPDATAGNCWAFTMARWRKHGGYMAIRPSPRPFSYIPHAIWVENLDGVSLLQTMPIRRALTWYNGWRAFYFNYRITRGERRPGETRPAPLGD